MALPSGSKDPLAGLGVNPPTANDLLRRRWREWLKYATVGSIAVHVAVFVFVPPWQWSERFTSPGTQALALEWLPPFDSSVDPAGSAPESQPEEVEDEPDPESGVDGEELALADLVDILRDRVPTNFTPVATLPMEGERDPDERDPTAVDYSDLLRSLPIDLDRLATISPELSLSTAFPEWPLIRNPSTVVRFLRTGYNRVPGAPNANGSVTVAMWIDDRGSVEWAEVHESSGNTDLDDIALTVFNEVVEFRPPRGPGGAQPVAVLISIGFPF